ncbi:MAG: fused MFS/spermidine synthase [Planctomycetaceae bacterium]|nr:fused MFS/spermidine synthase [Planctomycetaceae bacterium]
MSSARPEITQEAKGTGRAAALFGVAVFVSAFLLFQIQPLVSKAILPRFGGTPAVWTTCMLFFQVALFGGYLYAHLLTSKVSIRGQVGLHVILIVIAIAMLRVLPEASWKPLEDESPTWQIVMLLGMTVGLPYFLLATTGPLLQRWFHLVLDGQSPYRLYALSNAGSLIALLSYPFLVEPLLELSSQARLWSMGFWCFALLSAGCGWRLWQSGLSTEYQTQKADRSASPIMRDYVLWFLLAMLASVIYLATTNQVCQDIAVVPFLWVVPLSLYLLSFILCFESDRWYRRRWWALAVSVLILGICALMLFGADVSLLVQVGVYFGMMFAVCMMCHGEVVRLRPSPRHLTAFYLVLSAGGAGGGLFVAVIAPKVFPDFWELHLGLLAAGLCAARVLFDDQQSDASDVRPPLLSAAVVVVLSVAIGTLFVESITNYRNAVALVRNFYGVLEVEQDTIDNATVLRHGQIIHGLQLHSGGMQQVPTTYYVRRSGIGRAIQVLQSRKQQLRVGLVGLGVGTLAAYGRPGDEFRFYEINPDVDWLAHEYFTFIDASPADVTTVLGDARLSLASESQQYFDLLVLDAFAGDAIPTHLLTREAFTEYLRHLNENGILAVHISNLHFDLRPVTDALSEAHQLASVTIAVPEHQNPVDPSSEWVLMAREKAVLDAEPLRHDVPPPQPQRVLWTDSFSNLFQVLKSS